MLAISLEVRAAYRPLFRSILSSADAPVFRWCIINVVSWLGIVVCNTRSQDHIVSGKWQLRSEKIFLQLDHKDLFPKIYLFFSTN